MSEKEGTNIYDAIIVIVVISGIVIGLWIVCPLALQGIEQDRQHQLEQKKLELNK